MAFLKENYVEEGAKLTYWRYSIDASKRFANKIITFGCPTSNEGIAIPQNGIVINMLGYSDEESRHLSSTPDKTHEFLICNWEEVVYETRPASLEEKRSMPQFTNLSDDELENTPCDIVLNILKIPHQDYDQLDASIGEPNESQTVYNILRANPVSRDYFGAAINV